MGTAQADQTYMPEDPKIAATKKEFQENLKGLEQELQSTKFSSHSLSSAEAFVSALNEKFASLERARQFHENCLSASKRVFPADKIGFKVVHGTMTQVKVVRQKAIEKKDLKNLQEKDDFEESVYRKFRLL